MSSHIENSAASGPDLIEVRFRVYPQYDGWRLDHFICARIPRLSRRRAQEMICAQASFGRDRLKPATRVRSEQEIVLLRPRPQEPPVPRHFRVLQQDAHLVAIEKPAGLPVHATARFHRNTLTAVLRERFMDGPVPSPAHRLDRETSGLMLLGRGRIASAALKQAFREHRVQKLYLAIVAGDAPAEASIDLPLGPDIESGVRVKVGVVAGGLPARTRCRTIARRGGYSLVEARPETGRQHQIRAHLAAIGFPIVGDKLYGATAAYLLEFIETGWTERLAARLLLPRQALHALSATFPHPHTGEELTIECPLAEDLQRFWDGLRRSGRLAP